MSLPKLEGINTAMPQGESVMEMLAGMPEWLVWCAAGAAGAFALAVLVSIIEACLDLEAG